MRAVRVASALAIALAVGVLVCWRGNLATPDMRPLTAACLLFFATAVQLLAQAGEGRSFVLGRVLALIGALVAITSLLEYVTPITWGLGPRVATWFSSAPIADARLSPLTAIGLFFEGLALLLLGCRPSLKHCPGQWLGLVPLVMAVLALIGHSYGVVQFYKFAAYSGMALSTAIGLLLVALSTLFSRPMNYPVALLCVENLGGYVARRVVPAAIFFPIIAGWLRLEGERRGIYDSEMGVALFASANIFFFTGLVASVSQKLATLDRQRDESAVLLRGTLEGTEDFIAVVDQDFRWVAFNDAHRREFRTLYGRDPSLGDSMLDAMNMPADSEAGRALWARALGGEAFRVTQEFGDPQRVRKWYEIRFTPIRNPAGRVVAAAQIVRDMTAWHAAGESLRQARDLAERSHAQQQAIVQSMAEGVVVFDPAGIVVDANRSALAMLAAPSLAELRSLARAAPSAFEVLETDGRPLPIEAWPNARALRGETFTNYELMVRRADASHSICVGFGGAPVRDAAGQIIFAVVTLRDITKEREAEQQLALARQQLEAHAEDLERVVKERTGRLTESLHEMERFSYSLSHDMRAPLRAMKGFSQMLEIEYGGKLGESGKLYLGRIAAAAGRLDQLIEDVLTYSRIVRERIKLEPVNVDQLTRQLIDENPAFQSKAAEIEIVGPLAPVMGHVAYLTQVVTNLLSNAVKFVAPGQKPRVKIWSTAEGGKVRLCIQDNGIGIAPDSRSKLFGMFQRLNPSYEGTGIGLNIVRKAVERLGGTVGLESEPGQGSLFWVELDAAPPS